MRALEAVLRGFRVLPMADAAAAGHVFITVTGSTEVIGAGHLAVMRDGAILANAGHFDVEIDLQALAGLAVAVRRDLRPHVDCYELADGRRLLLLAEGRVVNLVAAEGHPAQAMDLAFGVQALALAWLAGHAGELAADVHEVPARHRRRSGPPGTGRDRGPDRRPHPGPGGLPGLLAHRLLTPPDPAQPGAGSWAQARRCRTTHTAAAASSSASRSVPPPRMDWKIQYRPPGW